MMKLVNGGGVSNPEVKGLGLYQLSTQPGVTTSATENARRRMTIFQRVDTDVMIMYFDSGGQHYTWDGSTWNAGVWGVWGSTLPLDTYHIFELISDGTNWFLRISNASGTVLTSTTPVAWSNTLDNSDPYWFYWGEPYTDYYYADQKSDWFYIRKYVGQEPTTSVGGQESYLGYSYRRSITIDGDEVGGSSGYLTDFPVLVNLSDTWLKTAPDGDIQHASGWDIIFRGLDSTTCNGTAPCDLDFEIETYDGSTGKLVAWVRVPQVYAGDSDPGNDSVIYMYYGSGCVADDPQNATAVWNSNYKGVWHLAEKYDLDFDGSASYVDTGYNTHHTQTTIEAWIFPETFGQSNLGRVIDKREGGAQVLLLYLWDTGRLAFERMFDGNAGMWQTPTGTITLGTWQHIVVTYDESDPANDPSIYINGQLQTLNESSTPSGTAITNTDDYIIGARNWGSGWDRFWDGAMDELRIYNRILSAQEINDRCLGKKEPSREGLVIEYLMDEGSGNTVSDSSGNSHDGDMTGHAATWIRPRAHDSTANSNFGKRSTTMAAPVERINGCDPFDNQGVGIPDPGGSWEFADGGLDAGTSDFTISAWFYWSSSMTQSIPPLYTTVAADPRSRILVPLMTRSPTGSTFGFPTARTGLSQTRTPVLVWLLANGIM